MASIANEKFPLMLACDTIILVLNQPCARGGRGAELLFLAIMDVCILVPRSSRSRATFIGHGIHRTGSARKLAVVSKANALELGRFSTRNNFHRQVL